MCDTMRQLVDRLNETAHAYYVLDQPIISDREWDQLYDRLLQMEKETGIVLPGSPTRRVGGEPLASFEPHKHIKRLWSMDKVQSKGAFSDWIRRTRAFFEKYAVSAVPRFAIEYKLDGLSINLTYRNGELVQAATRGNGETGEAVLPQAMTIRDIPLTIPYTGEIEVHGEVIMRLSVLEAYNRTADEKLKNARNAAAGALRNLDPEITRRRRLSAYFYNIGHIENAPYTDQKGMFDFLRRNGFPVSPFYEESESDEELMELIDRIDLMRHTLDFLIDGAVVKVTDLAVREALGYTDKFPRWAVAFKFEAEEATTVLEGVTWEVGRTGKLTPLGHVAPVDFAGVTVKKATLNNYGDIQRKRLSLGTKIWIRRSNDVIPEILGAVDESETGAPIEKPVLCPACGTPLTEIGAHLFCPNDRDCRPQVVGRISHFASRNAMDIDSLSDKTAELLYDRLHVRDIADLYRLTGSELLTLPGFQQKKANRLIDGIQKSLDCALDAFLLGIGIPLIGRATARVLSDTFGSLDALMQANEETLSNIADIGPITAQSIAAFFGAETTKEQIARLREAGVSPKAENPAPASGVFSGKAFVLTGALPTMKREQAEQLILQNGGTVASSVSKKTAYVLLGESPGSKLAKAEALGIPTISEEEFLNMIQAK